MVDYHNLFHFVVMRDGKRKFCLLLEVIMKQIYHGGISHALLMFTLHVGNVITEVYLTKGRIFHCNNTLHQIYGNVHVRKITKLSFQVEAYVCVCMCLCVCVLRVCEIAPTHSIYKMS